MFFKILPVIQTMESSVFCLLYRKKRILKGKIFYIFLKDRFIG